MRYSNYLIEQKNQDIIVVDIQPAYEKYIHFKIWEFCLFLNEQDKILYFYNGDSMGMDSKDDMINFLFENELSEDKFNDITFVDKGYAFLRNWMDKGMDDDDIIKVLRYMDSHNMNDSRDIDDDVLLKLVPDIDLDYVKDDGIFIPDIDINVARRWNNAFICGGGRTECLAEVELLFEAFKIRTRRLERFIYG